MSLYEKRGVSAKKEEVHEATRKLDKGLFKNSFCKVFPDFLNNDDAYVNIMHADGAGTKSILAYLYWKETGDISVWKGIAQDAIVMNLDDLLCIGVYDNIIFNSTIDRNKNLIPADVLEEIITGTQEFFDDMRPHGININYLGGETADVGDIVRTIAVNGTMTARWPKDKIISNDSIAPGDVIVGLASYGQSTYESEYNSGIGSNGLTSARHDVLNKHYAENYKESYDNGLDKEVLYIGDEQFKQGTYSKAQLLLSPTRTFAPVIRQLMENHFGEVHGMIHCSGGGQTKCLKYMPDHVRIVKDNLFDTPEVFKLIQQKSQSSSKEMFEVFNMGCRMEIYCSPGFADQISAIAESFKIDARIIGRVEPATSKELRIIHENEEIVYQ